MSYGWPASFGNSHSGSPAPGSPHDALDRRLGARDVVLPRLPRVSVSVDSLGREALREEPAAGAPGSCLLQRLAGDGASDGGPALSVGCPDGWRPALRRGGDVARRQGPLR